MHKEANMIIPKSKLSRYNFSVVSVWKILTVRKILRFCSDNARWESVMVHKHGAGVKFPENCKD